MSTFELLQGTFGRHRLGEIFESRDRVTREPVDANLSCVHLPGGGLLYLRPNGVVDAVGVEGVYDEQICGVFRLGDEVSAIFAEDKVTPCFGGELVEISDFVLYFRVDGLGVSVHLEDPQIEDGPFEDDEWDVVLRCHVASVIVAKDADRLAAY